MNLIRIVLMALIRGYRVVFSPMKWVVFGPLARCRFTPSCSQYALDAVRLHGAARGSWLAARRICRCHPWGGCGEDPVPRPRSELRDPRSAPIVAPRHGQPAHAS